MVDVYPRKIDLDNVKKLKNFENITVVKNFDDLEKEIYVRKRCLKK
tara:strand:- start:178 stop:315 length:138 start_codon:yes stop_codon:yes gene_type:complete